jgi:acylglycerol lipase
VALASALAACAPRVQPSGPFDRAPRIDATALIARDGARLPLRVWTPDAAPRAAIAALHGFNDYANAFEDAGRAFAKRGIITYAIDQRGFGRAPGFGIWAGRDATINDLSALAERVQVRHPGIPLYLLGDSMGGAVVMSALARGFAPRPAGAVLVAPAVWGRQALGPVKSAALWLSAHTVPWFRATAEGLGVTPSDNKQMLRRLGRDPLIIKATRIDAIWGLVNLMDEAQAAAARIEVPVLLLYGTRDEVIPPAPVRAAVKALTVSGKARIAVYRSGYHMLLRDLQAATPIGDIAGWVLNPAAPLASGADRGDDTTPSR